MIAYVCPALKCKVLNDGHVYFVVLLGVAIAKFDRASPARTFGRRVDSMMRWLGQCTEVETAAFPAQVASFLAIAGSGDGRYRPPLTLA
jgi:hypothetical protein